MRLSLVQFKPELFEIKNNVKNAISLIKDTEEDLIIFPELAFTGYAYTNMQEVKDTSEDPKDEFSYSISKFRDFAIKNDKNIIYGFNEKSNDIFFNSSIFIKSDGSFSIYRKIHLFYREKLFFTPGDSGFFVEEFKGFNIGMAICFDWIFPESFRTLSVLGADLIAHPADLVLPHCQEANKTRSLENRVFIATSNRWGEETNKDIKYNFTGMSQLTSPKGEVIDRFSKSGNIVKTFDVDLNLSRNKNINDFNNVMTDRRKEFYM
ncbi:MAG: nitrilase-related carbon-nitrogen hydrolase [Thermotogota bacterium]